MHVLLFDIDGTLINTGGAGGAALRDAFCDEFDVAKAGEVAFSGRTDRAIGSSLFELHDVEDTDETWQRLCDAYLDRLPVYLPRHRGRILPGVSALLARMAGHEDVVVGLLTGNLREGARIKLEFFDLFQYFPFGGFGDEYRDRNQVAQQALVAAQQHVDGRSRGNQVWVIGDTPRDVACGRAIEAHVLAVATGLHPRDELAVTHPDVLLDDLSDTEQVIEGLGL